jgi:hypothetical protein
VGAAPLRTRRTHAPVAGPAPARGPPGRRPARGVMRVAGVPLRAAPLAGGQRAARAAALTPQRSARARISRRAGGRGRGRAARRPPCAARRGAARRGRPCASAAPHGAPWLPPPAPVSRVIPNIRGRAGTRGARRPPGAARRRQGGLQAWRKGVGDFQCCEIQFMGQGQFASRGRVEFRLPRKQRWGGGGGGAAGDALRVRGGEVGGVGSGGGGVTTSKSI